ncbi:MAG: alpha-hydroxy-acid oxidizing protein [Clostridia bacterium]|nr:alpha-hydroxy-acid oxidizing protein [Clostridia bacterium]
MEKYDVKPVDVNDMTREYIDSIMIEERLIDAVLPSIKVNIFGEEFDTPIMTPAFSHMHAKNEDEEDPMVAYSRAAKECNAVNWVGMEPNEIVGKMLETGARTIRIIKPFADHSIIRDQMAFAEEHNAFALGIDIDHVFGYNGAYDVCDGYQMGPITQQSIREFVQATDLPFVIKGVLSVHDALKCADCGVKGIVVSHHHGRLPSAVPPLMVLPDIADALKGSGIQIFADCHIDSGVDAFKAIALGADAVSVGRAMMRGLSAEGAQGVVKKIKSMNTELITVMGYTGFSKVKDIEPSVLW